VRALGLVIALSLASCGHAPEHRAVESAVLVANTTRLAIETSEAAAKALYRQEQRAVLADTMAQGGNMEDAKRAVTVVRSTWKPVWDALAAARQAHEGLRSAIEAYEAGRGAVADVIVAAGKLRAAEDSAAEALRTVRGPD